MIAIKMRMLFLFFVFFIIINSAIYSSFSHDLDEKEKCNFISPFSLQDNLKRKYSRYRDDNNFSLLDYKWGVSDSDLERLNKCELQFVDKIKSDETTKKYLYNNYKKVLMGPSISGGDYKKGNLYFLSLCELHSCIANIHSDIFDKEGNLIATVLSIYPSSNLSDAGAQQMSDYLTNTVNKVKYPLESWILIKKVNDTDQTKLFIKESLSRLEKGSGATIVKIRDLSD